MNAVDNWLQSWSTAIAFKIIIITKKHKISVIFKSIYCIELQKFYTAI